MITKVKVKDEAVLEVAAQARAKVRSGGCAASLGHKRADCPKDKNKNARSLATEPVGEPETGKPLRGLILAAFSKEDASKEMVVRLLAERRIVPEVVARVRGLASAESSASATSGVDSGAASAATPPGKRRSWRTGRSARARRLQIG